MQTSSPPQKWLYVMLSIGNLTGLTLFLGAASLLAMSSLFNLLVPATDRSGDPASSFLLAFALGLCALVFIPAAYYSLQQALGKPIRSVNIRQARAWQIVTFGIAWIGCSFLSNFLYGEFSLGWLAAAPFFLAAIGLPVAALVWIGLGGLPLGSRNRFWSSLALSTSIAPLVAALLEFGLGLGLFILVVMVLVFRPDWLSSLQQLANQLSNITDFDKGTQLIAPILMNPVAITIMFLVMSVFIPLIEEAVKPLVVWGCGRRLHNATEGFALGVLCGAGFALVEGLMAASSPSQGWGTLLVARAGGSLMHITASGLMGWAIASAWQGKRLRLLWTYLVSVSIHGLWNVAAVLSFLANLQTYLQASDGSTVTNMLSLASGGIIAVIVPAILVVLILINRHLQSTVRSQSDIIARPASPN